MYDSNPIFQIPQDKRAITLAAAEEKLRIEPVDIFDYSKNPQIMQGVGYNPYLSPKQLESQQNAKLYEELNTVSEEILRCRSAAIAKSL